MGGEDSEDHSLDANEPREGESDTPSESKQERPKTFTDREFLSQEDRLMIARQNFEDLDKAKRQIADFLDETGAIDLIMALGNSPSGLSFEELKTQVPNSSATLNKRKDEAIELNLIYREIDTSGRGSTPIYNLGNDGNFIKKLLDERGITELRTEIKTLQSRLESQKKKLQDDIEREFFRKGRQQ